MVQMNGTKMNGIANCCKQQQFLSRVCYMGPACHAYTPNVGGWCLAHYQSTPMVMKNPEAIKECNIYIIIHITIYNILYRYRALILQYAFQCVLMCFNTLCLQVHAGHTVNSRKCHSRVIHVSNASYIMSHASGHTHQVTRIRSHASGHTHHACHTHQVTTSCYKNTHTCAHTIYIINHPQAQAYAHTTNHPHTQCIPRPSLPVYRNFNAAHPLPCTS